MSPFPNLKDYSSQGSFGNCYVNAALINFQYTETLDLGYMKDYSLSDATCIADKKRYREGGSSLAFLLRMAKQGDLVSCSRERISHQEVADKFSIYKSRCDPKDADKIVQLEEFFWKKVSAKLKKCKREKISNFSIERLANDKEIKDADELWKNIENSLKRNKMILSMLSDHVVNIIASNTYVCEKASEKFEVKTFALLDPNGVITEVTANNILSFFLKNRRLYNLKINKKKVDYQDIYNADDEMIHAALTNETDIAESYLKKNPENLNKEVNGKTPLSSAIEMGLHDMVKFLITKGADPNKPLSKKGDTALIQAIALGHEDIAKTLILNGGDPHQKNKKGETALSLAKKHWPKNKLSNLMKILN